MFFCCFFYFWKCLGQEKNTIPPPKNVSIKVLCDQVNISWSPPRVLQGYHIEGYTLNLKNSNVTYFTNETTLTIMFNDTLIISEHYQIEFTGHYCGGIGNASLVSFIVADVPSVSEQVEYELSEDNETHVAMILQTEVLNNSCLVSYPSRVSIIILCDDKIAVNTTKEVLVSSDNIIRMNMTLPIDKTCNGEFRWKNEQPKEFVNNVTIDTKNLISCSIHPKTNGLVFQCSCINSSPQCCEVEAVDVLTNESYYNKTNHIGSFSYLCSGNYSVTCNNFRSSKLPLTTQLISVPGEMCQSSSSLLPTVIDVVTPSSESKLPLIIGVSIGAFVLLAFVLVLLAIIIMLCNRKGGKNTLGGKTKSRKSSAQKDTMSQTVTNRESNNQGEDLSIIYAEAKHPHNVSEGESTFVIEGTVIDQRTTTDSAKPMVYY